MREDLMAYVLGELDESARQQIERELANDPELKREIARIRRCLCDTPSTRPGADDELPTGLADRIAHNLPAWCADHSAEDDCLADEEEDFKRYAPSHGFTAGACSFSMVDMTVAMAVLLALGSLLMPALNSSRSNSQRLGCQNNLREMGVLLTQYAHDNQNYLPFVSPREHAGAFAIRLASSDIASREQIARLLVCPASPLATQLRLEGTRLSIPTIDEYFAARGEELLRIRRTSGGGYAVKVGYVKGPFYMLPRFYGSSMVPLLSDGPNVAEGRTTGANHGGNIINILYQDGRVQPQSTCVVASSDDHLYLSHEGQPYAGRAWNDTVMSPSHTSPLPWHFAISPRFNRLMNAQSD
jgi:prepilin-type processing-associated H-X9-DG protein